MHNSKRSHRHVRLLAVLSIVMMLTSVFPWYQAAGQDASPEADDSVLTTESTQTETTGEGDGATTPLGEGDEGDSGVDDSQVSSTPPSVTDIAIQCDTVEQHVIGATISVANPQAGASLDVHIVANGDSGPVVTDPDEGTFTRVPLLDATTSYPIRLPMKPEVAQMGGTVSVMALVTGDPTSEFTSVTQLPVYASNSVTLCGTPPVDSGESADPDSTDLPVDTSEEDPGSIASITALPALTAVSISCTSEGSDSVTALVTITDPPTDVTTVSAQLYANGEPIGTAGSAAIDGATDVPVIVSLPASDIGATSLSAKAWITGDDTTAVESTADVTVHFSEADGKTLCGVAPTEPDEEDPADEEEPAPTTQYATVVNTGGAQLRCRAAPVNGATLGMFAAGARVELRGAASNGWYPVVCPNGQDGHASSEYLRAETSSTPTEPTPGDTSNGVAVVFGTNGAGLRCRATPVSGSIIGVYPDGTRLPMRGSVENGWAPVTCGGSAGWVSTQYARVESGGGTTDPTPTPAPGTGTGKYGTVVNTGGQGLRCRTAPVSGAIILVAPEGTKLETRGAAVNNWYPVVCNGQSGHVSGDYFTLSTDGGTTTPPVSGGTSVAMVSGTGGGGLRCRTQPVDGATITVMPEGSLVDVRGSVVNGWAPVKCAGQSGWASAAYLNFNVSGGATGTLWMDVDLGDQYMRVYRGNTVIAQTYVSTGRPGFTTPTGNFYINYKLRSQTMSGVLGGEYYYVPNVPWVMYFTNVGHAIHGAYWHNNFGQVMSHGCINLPVGFAEWLYSVTPYGALVRIHW